MLHSLVGSSSSSCEEGGSDEGGVVSNERDIVQSLKKNPTVKNEKDRAEGGIDFKKKLEHLSNERIKLAKKNEAKRKARLKNKIKKSVYRAFDPSDVQALRDEGVELFHLPLKKRPARDESSTSTSGEKGDKCSDSHPENEELLQKWNHLKEYLDPNPQLRGTDQGKYTPQSGLELSLDKAVEEGDFERAVQLSDQLAGREFATKVAKSFDCLKYLSEIEEEEARRQKRKRVKLKWGMEAKQKWETKSNM